MECPSGVSPLGPRRIFKPKGKSKRKDKMSEQKTKSNAPWILGIVGLVLTVVHTACAIICSAAISAGDTVFNDASDAEAQATFDNGMNVAAIGVGIMAICFVLSFFGKSKASGLTGFFLVIGGIAAAGISVAHFSAGGIAAGIVYMCSGISSICNRKKIKA